MHTRRTLAGAALGAALLGGAMAAPAAAASNGAASMAMTCDAWSNSTQTIAYGSCTGTIPSGVRWRLGVICDSGYYYWSPWQTRPLTKSYDCPGVPGKVTSTWIDVE
ncbi:hypothetical protein [Streptomyces sp. 35G-GA-8]|uniref:hypothetical protein n=1 Tax=Streptomyces sp. 35G-GA-8 TaxID=2939434 RepID=UPI00201EACE2|nr:hypothetical protein [Streptomyces sp. 35G-GA-8]MCL7382247.1 hypothetical protein [Streptomyces sp. 35G-GA-8]